MFSSTAHKVWSWKHTALTILLTALALSALNITSIYAYHDSQPTQAEIEAKVTSGDYHALLAKAAIKPVRLLVTLNLADYLPEGDATLDKIKEQRGKIKQLQKRVTDMLTGKKFKLLAAYDIFPIIAIEADQDALLALSAVSSVLHIKEDIPEPPVDLSADSVIHIPQTYALGYTGVGQVVVILDSGVQTGHPFIKGRILAEACFSTTDTGYGSVSICANGASTTGNTPGMAGPGSGLNCPVTVAGCSHGTHVAGIALGRNYTDGPGFDGVAKGAKFISIQVFSRFNSPEFCTPDPAPCVLAYNTDTIAALQYVYTTLSPAYAIASVNMSLGGGRYTSYCDSDPRKSAIDNLRSRKIATVIAAGNAGYTNAIGTPACISSAISVGATTDTDTIAPFSNRAGFLRLFAPGVGIDSSVPTNKYDNYDGTSMAAPHVAGAWAIMKCRKPSASVTEILNALRNTGIPISIGGSSVPRIRLDVALKALSVGTLTPTRTPTHLPTSLATSTPTHTPTPAMVPTNTPSSP